jgi:hypothetical protein
MADSQSDGGGYGKPPKSGQFKPGQSGNPAGRPRKGKLRSCHGYAEGLTPNDRMMLEESDRIVRVREGDRLFELSQAQAAMRSTYAKALKGSPMAQRTVIEQNQRVQAIEMRRRQEIWESYQSYVREWHQIAARAKAQNRPAPTTLPHPDDIEFGDSLCVFVRGPRTVEELKRYLVTVDFRELFLAMNAYGDLYQQPREDHDNHINFWLFGGCVLNAALPPSLSLESEDFIARGIALATMSRSRLVEHMTDLCRRLGVPFKVALLLSRRGQTPIRSLRLKTEHGQLALESGWSLRKLLKLMWTDIHLEPMTARRLELMKAFGLVARR